MARKRKKMNQKNEKIEKREFAFDVTATEEGNHITGRPIVYNAPTIVGGIFREVFEPGALNKTDLKDVPLLVGHDRSAIPVARSRRNNGNSTMQLTPGPEGLDIDASLDVANNDQAKALYSAVKRQDISGMSAAFTVEEEEWTELDTDMPTRHIRSVSKVYEVSAVTFPAYEQTSLVARSAGEALESAKAALERARAEERDSIVRDEIRKMIKGE
mgnify:CR=1 FL=1|jgi:HK97 family phage prohead protease|nr:MAG TPA_asm: prohead serine protease [Caudoviricetes sp.]